MKLLVVFLSALVLAAQGNVASSDEVVAGYAAVPVQEPSGVDPQVVFAKEAEPRVGSPQEPEVVSERDPEAGVYIPIVTRACNNAACANICHRLGFIFGICTSASTCWCRN